MNISENTKLVYFLKYYLTFITTNINSLEVVKTKNERQSFDYLPYRYTGRLSSRTLLQRLSTALRLERCA